jgi:hypothetical protein
MGRSGRHGSLPRDDDRYANIKHSRLRLTNVFRACVDGNPNHSTACGKTATATWNGKSITIGIVDRCYACGYDDIDLAPAAFQQFADLGEWLSRISL